MIHLLICFEICIQGLNKRLEKLHAKAKELRNHIQNNTIPSIIFGGKKSFYGRMKGNVTKEEWKELQSITLYACGDASKKGNLNTRIVFDEEKWNTPIEEGKWTTRDVVAQIML